MDTNQIRRLCRSRFNNVFLDCVAIDDLKDEEFLSELCDRLRIGSFLMIFNVDPKSKAGWHSLGVVG